MRPVTKMFNAGPAATARRSSGLIIADDLTGAADACVAFTMRGLSGAVTFDGTDAPASASVLSQTTHASADVIAISTDSRGLPPPLAASCVRAAVRRHAARAAFARAHVDSADPAALWLFKKIDSTLRGPVGAEIHAMMSAAHRRVAIVAPAFPSMGRIVDRGVLRTTGRGALPEADIVHLLREAGLDGCVSVMRPVTSPMTSTARADGADRLRDLHALCAGWRDALSAARSRGARVFVCDSVDQADLDAIVAAVYETGAVLDGAILWAGAAGLAHALATYVTGVRREVADGREEAACGLEWSDDIGRHRRHTRATSIVFAIGSTHPVTVAQRRRLEHDAMPIATASVDDAAAIERALTMRIDIVVVLSHDAGDTAVSRFAELLVARDQAAPDSFALVMSGGDTAARLCRELRAARIDLGGEVAPGIPWGTLSLDAPGRRPDVRWPVVLKAGGFGADDGLIRVRRFLMESHERRC